MKSARPVKCPTCKKQGNWFEGDYGPFCSHRPEHLDPFIDLPPDQDPDRPEKDGQ